MSENDLKTLLQPYIPTGIPVPERLYAQLMQYLELLLKWNARTNLTAIREPEEIIRRHFGESLFAAQHLVPCETLLDFGSGAGFPGLPIQLMHPEIHVTLAESQNKKATFLREVIRSLGVKTEVWARRVEEMPTSDQFEVVTLRAVDKMEAATAAASPRAGRQIMLMTTVRHTLAELPGFALGQVIPIPDANEQQLLSFIRQK